MNKSRLLKKPRFVYTKENRRRLQVITWNEREKGWYEQFYF